MIILCSLLAVGCGDLTIPHPDAPLFVVDTFGSYVKVAAYDKEEKLLVDCGWTDIKKYQSWTLVKFNWQDRIDADNK